MTVRRVRVVGALFSAFVTAAGAAAQQPAAAPFASTITGQILASGSDVPLRRARVVVTNTPRGAGESVLTDNQGRFEMPVTGIGPFRLTVMKGGHVTAETTIRREDLSAPFIIRLPRGAAISGVVVDPNGRPATSVSVAAHRLDENAPAEGVPEVVGTQTDDRGEFRLAGLARGRYGLFAGTVVSITPARSTVLGDPHATVSVDAGEEIAGVQLTTQEDRRRTALAQAVAGVASASSQLQRSPPTPLAGGIQGRVTTDSGEAAANVAIRVSGEGAQSYRRTDADGAFAFPALRGGEYSIDVSIPGQESWQYGQDRFGGTRRSVIVPTDTIVSGVDFVIPASVAIAGTIVDEHGEPLQGVHVRALHMRHVEGRLAAAPVGNGSETDDRGRYRLVGLQPGAYLVAATIDSPVSTSDGGRIAYAPTYYPGTYTFAAAAPLEVQSEAVANFALAAVALADIVGSALDGNASLVSGTARLMESRRSEAMATPPRTAEIGNDGSFVFRQVPPGDYVLQVLGSGPGRTGLFATRTVSVGSDTIELTIPTSYGTALEGRIVLDTAANERFACGDPDGVRLNPACAVRGPSAFRIAPVALDDSARAEPTQSLVTSGTDFFVTGLFGPTAFALRAGPSDDWFIKSFTVNGFDIVDSGFDFGARPRTIDNVEVVLSDNGAVITGWVAAAQTRSTSYAVVVFPAAAAARVSHSRRIKVARSAADGSFRLGGLPSGDYLVAAVNRIAGGSGGGEWQDAGVLRSLEPLAQRISLVEGRSQTVTLRLIQR